MVDSLEPWILPFGSRFGARPRERWLWNRIRTPSDPIRRHIEAQGLLLRRDTAERDEFDAAEDLILLAPTLAAIVEERVSEVHLLEAEAGFDISHSEPQWRTRIFVSTPKRNDIVGALRLAESVIHEAMHLQLTGYEALHPIITDESLVMPSPWRMEPRPIRGVAHGLFVFSCLSSFFKEIEGTLGLVGRAHALNRIREICEQIQIIHVEDLEQGLTPTGAALAQSWITVGSKI
jgi:HEXXH motif-containing protein